MVCITCACQKIRDDLLPQRNDQLYFQSILCPDSCIRVYVGKTTGIQDQVFLPVQGADVILSINNQFTDTISEIQPGIYESPIKPSINDTIKIEVLASGKMTGETIIPDTTYVIKPECVIHTFYDALNQQNYSTLAFSIDDNASIENYYEILIYESYYIENENYFRYEFLNTYYMIYKPDIVIINEGDWDFIPTTIFFSDKLFNGKVNNFSFLIAGIGPNSNVMLRSITKEYYYYRKFYTRHAFNAGMHSDGIRNLLFTGEPLDMYTNINGGLGVCASYSTTSSIIKTKE